MPFPARVLVSTVLVNQLGNHLRDGGRRSEADFLLALLLQDVNPQEIPDQPQPSDTMPEKLGPQDVKVHTGVGTGVNDPINDISPSGENTAQNRKMRRAAAARSKGR